MAELEERSEHYRGHLIEVRIKTEPIFAQGIKAPTGSVEVARLYIDGQDCSSTIPGRLGQTSDTRIAAAKEWIDRQ